MEKAVKPKKKMTWWKITLIVIFSLIGCMVLFVGSYLLYVITNYYRIPDNQVIEVRRSKEEPEVDSSKELKILSYNVGFGAYSPYYTFFLDKGYDVNGNLKTGKRSKGISYQDVMKNIEGSASIIADQDENYDFISLQEVDQDGDRSYHINQEAKFLNALPNYSSAFACNFHTVFLAYPLHDFYGKTDAGLQYFSKYKITSSLRKSYVVSNSIPDKFFDLDRCFLVNRHPVSGSDKELIIINSHMSAYDKGGVIRAKQLKQLNDFITAEYDKGNYVVVSGDFNHDLIHNNPLFPQYSGENFPFKDKVKEKRPEWIATLFDENGNVDLNENFSVRADPSFPTCRSPHEEWMKGTSFVTAVDGFIVSDNIEVKEVKTVVKEDDKYTGFLYSDHNPIKMTFTLK